MKGVCLVAFLGLSVAMTGCGTTHSMVKSGSSSHMSDSQMKAFLGLGDVRQTSNGIQLTVSADATFKKHSSRLSKEGMTNVDAIAAAILKYPGEKVLVIGYTDNSGTDMKNVKFSQHRADTVMKELIKQGVLAANLNAVGNGPVEPVASNDTAANKAKNRRIVFEIKAQ